MDSALFLGFQLLAHVLADFVFQNSRQAAQKNALGFKSTFLIWHVLLVFALSWVLSFQWDFIYGAVAIALTHYVIDGCKKYLNQHRQLGRYAFFIDQALHLIVIITVVLLFAHHQGIEPLIDMTGYEKWLWIGLGYLLCMKPANIVVKEVFNASSIYIATGNELPNAGKLIGTLERLLTLTFILIQQYEAVGFLIAAKSILRYRDDDTLKTEYVLIGTMLSFGMAVVIGILIHAL